MTSEIIMLVLELIITVAAALVAKYVIPYIQKTVDQNTLNLVSTWAKEAVYAAQQIMQTETGQEKKEYVVNFINSLLEEKNITISEEQLNVLIESAVKQLKIESN
jgi:LL-H family phage holin